MENKDKLNYIGASVSIFLNIGLFFLKYWAGIISGSIALMADAWHTLSDSLSSVFLLFGIKLSNKKADKEHPFGHGRWEQIVSFFIGFLLAVVAYEFIVEAIAKINNREKAIFGTLAIIVTIISIVIKEGMAQMSFYIARKTKNSAMKADGWHHRSDALSSVVILIGIFLQKYIWWIDSALGIIVALILFYIVFQIIKESISKLLGEEIPENIINEIKNLIKENFLNDFNAHHFHLHNYGKHKELTFHIKIDPEMTVENAHKIATNIELLIFSKLNITTTIHIEPSTVSH